MAGPALVCQSSSASALLINRLSFKQGAHFHRWAMWSDLAKHSYSLWPEDMLFGTSSSMTGLMLYVYVFPFYFFFLAFTSFLALCIKDDQRLPARERLRDFLYRRVFKKMLLAHDAEYCCGKVNPSASEALQDEENQTDEESEADARERNVAASDVSIGLPWVAPVCLGAVVLLVFEIVMLIPALLATVSFFVLGRHISVAVIVGLEVATSLADIDIGAIWQFEVAIVLSFEIPLVMPIHFHSLAFLRDADHRLSKLSLIYLTIPVNVSQAALKVADMDANMHAQEADRTSAYFVASVHGAEENEIRFAFVGKRDEDEYVKRLHVDGNDRLPGTSWRGSAPVAEVESPTH